MAPSPEPGTPPRRLRDEDELERALAAPRFLLFKHSTSCPVSARAFRAYERFVAAHPGTPTGWIHVVEERPLSRAVEARTGVRHESPQALLLAGGRTVWHASHGAVTKEALERATQGSGAGTARDDG